MATLKVHIENACAGLVKSLHEPYQSFLSAFMSNRILKFAGKHCLKHQTAKFLKQANHPDPHLLCVKVFGVIAISFGWFLRVQSLHAIVFVQKTYCGLSNLNKAKVKAVTPC